MTEDGAVEELLAQVAAQWSGAGVLDVLCDLVKQVWRADLDRYEPETMGDDAMSLGMQASRNLCNLAVKRLQGVPGVRARAPRTLEITFADRVLHVSKAPSDSLTWDVHTVDWDDSEVRESAAAANSAAYQSRTGTLFEDWDPLPGQQIEPAALRHLHLTWQGFADGTTRTWLGFPQLGLRPWYAVMMIDDESSAAAVDPAGTEQPPGAPADPDFDRLGEHDLRIAWSDGGRQHGAQPLDVRPGTDEQQTFDAGEHGRGDRQQKA